MICFLLVGIAMATATFCRQNDIGFQPFHRCVTKNEDYISYHSENRHNYVIDCTRRQTCQVANFNAFTQTCMISEEPCLIAQPDEAYYAIYFKTPLDTCVNWVPLGQQRLEYMISLHPCNTPDITSQLYCYIARSTIESNVLPGVLYTPNNPYVALDGVVSRDGSWEVLELVPGCAIQWVNYTAGNVLP